MLLPDVGELLRHYVFFGIWQTFIITIGVNQIFNVKGIKGVMIGLLSAGIFGVMVYVFIR
ncbi:MAG: hypothetical protein PF505_09485 [Vallitaleaceae bacterium]|nr:hypothetical protein [Vallitaleaceae bacterium]